MWYVSYKRDGATTMRVFKTRPLAIRAACEMLSDPSRQAMLVVAPLTGKDVPVPRWIDPPGTIPKFHIAVLRSGFEHGQGAINAASKARHFDYLESLNVVVCVQEIAAVNVHDVGRPYRIALLGEPHRLARQAL